MRSVPRSDVDLRLVGADEAPPSLDGVYRRYTRYVAAIILRLGGRTPELEDLVQDVFLDAARGIDKLRQPDAIKGWLATITVRVVRRRLRLRRARRFLGRDSTFNYEHVADAAASPFDKLLVAAVYRILDELPVADRLAFSLHHIQGEKLPEVARLCGCSEATAKRRIARAMKRVEGGLSRD